MFVIPFWWSSCSTARLLCGKVDLHNTLCLVFNMCISDQRLSQNDIHDHQEIIEHIFAIDFLWFWTLASLSQLQIELIEFLSLSLEVYRFEYFMCIVSHSGQINWVCKSHAAQVANGINACANRCILQASFIVASSALVTQTIGIQWTVCRFVHITNKCPQDWLWFNVENMHRKQVIRHIQSTSVAFFSQFYRWLYVSHEYEDRAKRF